MSQYNPKEIEKKWQARWEEQKLYKTPVDATSENKMYILPQLPYPSGSGLHVGHAEVYTACDIFARYQRMTGKKVLQAIGWDSFGLPAENYAIKTNVHPRINTDKAIENFRSQIKQLGISVDWEREVGSHNADYYKWTQWFFLLMYKRGLAYRKNQAVNWCDSCKTVLANAQIVEGACERCDTPVLQKEMEQWYLKITDYADRLIDDLDKVDWPQETITRQRNWIGRSEGAEVQFSVKDTEENITVFTTRPDTLFGATYMVLAPEHALVQGLQETIKNWDEVQAYVHATEKKSNLDRQVDQEKTGVELKGVKAINPANGEEVPVWIADYVLATYGTGAIMAVPAHDERDFAFAKKFGLEIRQVVAPSVAFTGKKAMKDGVETLNRRCIDVIIENSDGGKFLLLRDVDGVHFVGGGVEEGESIEEALTKEIKEESGYVNYVIRSRFIEHFNAQGYRITKNKNQITGSVWFHVQLTDEERVSCEVDEGRHEMYWQDKKKVATDINWDPHALAWNMFVEASTYSGEGVVVNSEFLNDLTTQEAKTRMFEWLEEKNIGKKKTQYKLRDWSVSRQRFWGAPIPVISNEEEKNKKRLYVCLHGYGSGKEAIFWPWLKQELELQGHIVKAFDLPNTEKPKADEQATFALEQVTLDENTVIVSQSHGAAVALRMLEQSGKNIAKLCFVDPVYVPEFNDKKRTVVEDSTTWEFDTEKVKALCSEITIIGDNAFPIIKKEHLEKMATDLDARLVYAQSNKPHFDGNEEQVILDEALISGLRPLTIQDLPVILPDDVDFKPTGQSPLNYSPSFQDGVEEKYGKGWKREVDTLDTFMCSSWYFFRYLDPKNDEAFASKEQLKKWMPIDFYLGGEEHVNGHLLYSRFFTKVLFDEGLIDFDEPFKVNRHQGLISGEDGRKMSKRWGNVINPTDVVNEYGADTVRMYEMFMGPLDQAKAWNTGGVKGVRRFLEKVWKLQEKLAETGTEEMNRILHKTIKKVTGDTAELQFNTAIAAMMECANAFTKETQIAKDDFATFVSILAPYAPHMAEELWEVLGKEGSATLAEWPAYDESKLVEDTLTVAVQVNGKLRGTITLPADATEAQAFEAAHAEENVQRFIDGKEPKKQIYIPGRIVNIVV